MRKQLQWQHAAYDVAVCSASATSFCGRVTVATCALSPFTPAEVNVIAPAGKRPLAAMSPSVLSPDHTGGSGHSPVF